MNRYKFVEFGGEKYRIAKLPAMTACYIGMKLMAVMGGSADFNAGLTKLSKEGFFELQRECLAAVNKMIPVDGGEMPEAIIRADGKFTDPEMEYDLGAVFRLTVEVLIFNVSGFFGGKGLEELTKSLSLPTK